MSDDETYEADCSDVLADVYVFIDNECDEVQRDVIRHHLDECSPCLQRFGIEQEVKQLLAKKCGSEHAPDSLRDSLKARLTEISDQP